MKNIVTVGDRKFRYDRLNSIVECISKATNDMEEENIIWQSRFGENLWDIDSDGYIVLASAGLAAENWDDSEARAEYLNCWALELDEEDACLAEQFVRYEMNLA